MVTVKKKKKHENPLWGLQTLMLFMGGLVLFLIYVASNGDETSTSDQHGGDGSGSSFTGRAGGGISVTIQQGSEKVKDKVFKMLPSMMVSRDPPPQPRSILQLECATAVMPLFWSATAHIDRIVLNPACPRPNLMTGPAPLSSSLDDNNSNNKVLTIVMTYYNRPIHLAQQLQAWLSWSEAVRLQIVLVIVDDGSTVGLRAVELLEANAMMVSPSSSSQKILDICVYEIDQDIPWNVGGARNLGFYMAPTDWVLLIDDDTFVPSSQTMEYVLHLSKKHTKKLKGTTVSDRRIFHNFLIQASTGNISKDNNMMKLQPAQPDKGTEESLLSPPMTLLTTKTAFWLTTGFDEDFCGHYGQTNQHFLYRAERTKRIELKDISKDMEQSHIPPFVQLSETTTSTSATLSCPSGWTCPDETTILQKTQEQKTTMRADEKKKRSKDTNKNFTIFGRKQRTSIVWSKLFLRFTWRRVM